MPPDGFFCADPNGVGALVDTGGYDDSAEPGALGAPLFAAPNNGYVVKNILEYHIKCFDVRI